MTEEEKKQSVPDGEAPAEQAEEPEQSGEPKTEKKEKRKNKKDSELEKLKDELAAKSDLLVRTAAEFDNYKRRTERERSGVAEYARAGIIKQLLPILDNVDRAAAADRESAEYLKGVEMIVKQLEALAGNLGIKEVAAVGDTFDPNMHDAVMHIEDDSFGESVVAEVLQKGYRLGDTVVRPAMVKVAN